MLQKKKKKKIVVKNLTYILFVNKLLFDYFSSYSIFNSNLEKKRIETLSQSTPIFFMLTASVSTKLKLWVIPCVTVTTFVNG